MLASARPSVPLPYLALPRHQEQIVDRHRVLSISEHRPSSTSISNDLRSVCEGRRCTGVSVVVGSVDKRCGVARTAPS